MEPIIHNDEPTCDDRLDREQYAEAFARLAETCDTPFVIGLYGKWGAGKTSLMQQIKEKLDPNKSIAIWYDPWQHQFEKEPAVALAHEIVRNLDPSWKKEGKKLLWVISIAFASIVLKKFGSLEVKDVMNYGEKYEKETFQILEYQTKLRDHFNTLVAKARIKPDQNHRFRFIGRHLRKLLRSGKDEEEKRTIVFFIDDLDRCLPEDALKVLQAIKLYLNIEGCIYFLGADPHALELSIRHCYKDLDVSEIDYLDKIVQLPFIIPPIQQQCLEKFLVPLLPTALHSCVTMLIRSMGDNPRQIKRFINILTFRHHLAMFKGIEDYEPKLLALVLIIQTVSPALYKIIASQQDVLLQLKRGEDDTKRIYEKYIANHESIIVALEHCELSEPLNLEPYIFLTSTDTLARPTGSAMTTKDLQAKLYAHKQWLDSSRAKGARAILFRADLRRAGLGQADLRAINFSEANLMEATLSGADLRRADLTKANLRKADLRRADLRRSRLFQADLRGANLKGADLRNTNITSEQLRDAITDRETALPVHDKEPAERSLMSRHGGLLRVVLYPDAGCQSVEGKERFMMTEDTTPWIRGRIVSGVTLRDIFCLNEEEFDYEPTLSSGSVANLSQQAQSITEGRLGLDFIRDELSESLKELLEIDIFNLFLSAWMIWREIAEIVTKETSAPSEVLRIPLSEHTITSEQMPSLGMYYGENLIGRITFRILAVFTLEGFTLKIRNNNLVEVMTGTCRGKVSSFLEDQIIFESEKEHIKLPTTLAIFEDNPEGG